MDVNTCGQKDVMMERWKGGEEGAGKGGHDLAAGSIYSQRLSLGFLSSTKPMLQGY